MTLPRAVAVLEAVRDHGGKLLEGVAPGPWEAAPSGGLDVPMMVWGADGDALVNHSMAGKVYLDPENATFIAASRSLVPAMVEGARMALEEWKAGQLYSDTQVWPTMAQTKMFCALASAYSPVAVELNWIEPEKED